MSATATATAIAGTTPIPTGLPDAGSPLPPEHSFLWYFFVIVIELSVLIGLVVVTKLTVSKGSGLNDPEKVRRIWARAPEIRFQPVMRPLVFAVGVGYGSQTVLNSLVGGVLALLGLGTKGAFNHWVNAVVSIASFCASSWLCMVIYRATGGTRNLICAASMVLTCWVMNGLVLNLALGLYRKLTTTVLGFLGLALVHLVVLGAIQGPFLVMGQNTKLPATARLIYNSTVVPGWVKLDRTILVAAGPLAFIYFVAYICEFRLNNNSYWSNITLAFATFMILSASALTAIISVNRALLANEFQWQWRAFLTPAIPLGAMKTLMAPVAIFAHNSGFLYSIWSVTHFTLSCGACGVLGAYVYMMLAERYAKAHFDEDELAHDDILAEFEEDEDNEELEV